MATYSVEQVHLIWIGPAMLAHMFPPIKAVANV